ncbi:tumor necrosis factor receptor family protein [Levilactobacillus namurensis]|uniref:Gram-positive cocci surface proteins LPxTG domain-containing protein n=1 Tax=Levilactobacillus namurensis TaxID=380393 RepID=A0AAW8W265_9LACO|nr:hypothetical protein [Levilactobacillus namurensis]MDT7012879.1 hypothetical protein [Levilactobacillus namurensis]
MRLKWIGWLLVGLLWCWGGVTPVQAATDAQQSQYQVKLTPSASSVTSGSDGNLVSGGSGATGSTGSTESTDHHPSAPGDSAGSAASPSAATGQQAASAQPTGRLPQLSEGQWLGLASLLGIILCLMLGVWHLSRRGATSASQPKNPKKRS